MNLDVGSGGGPYGWKPRAEVCLSYDIPSVKGEEDIVKGDAHHLPFKDGQFNTVYAYNLLEHVRNPWTVLSELRRVAGTVRVRQDTMFNLASYATPEHLWFQLPNLKFLPYPRTKIGIAISRILRVTFTEIIPSLPHHHQLSRLIGFFMSPHQQYEVSLVGRESFATV